MDKAEQLAARLKQAAPLSMILIADACATELRRLAPMEAILRRIAESGGLKNADLIAARKALGETI